MHLQGQCNNSESPGGVNVLDPKTSNRKGAPRKLRRKSALESTSKKAKGTSNKSKGKRLPPSRTDMEEATSVLQLSGRIEDSQPTQFSYSQLLGDVQSQVCAQQLSSSTFTPPLIPYHTLGTSGPCVDQLNGTDRFPRASHIADDMARNRPFTANNDNDEI
ncbi:uncharacterized protein LOC111382594 isoform X2 [Olea europaea var. sylvestris]|uniref:uncharacterized protein LOC111382594 isoform X2 n=1 Tax=Olea europaea var. sylvestris TaxID=158386 RepID=UPI000C1CE1F6|nr:uncharacterized protein LOC111382594 isoform X2 [Olea europaea var. sylvestris]